MADSGELLFSRNTDNKGSDHSDIWDDSALIVAYDKAISGAYKKIASRRRASDSMSDNFSESCSDAKLSERETVAVKSKKRQSSTSKQKKIKWKIGDYCRAIYNADGLVYDCKITHLDKKNNGCIVEFVGYGNTQSVPVSELLVSERKRSVLKQVATVENDVAGGECGDSDVSRSEHRDSKRSKSKASTKQNRSSPSVAFMPPRFTGMEPNDPTNPQISIPPPPPPPWYFSNRDEVGEEDEALSAMLMSWYMSGYHTGYYQGLKQAKNKAHT